MGTVENQQGQDIDDDWVRERKKEFEEVIDANHDSIVTMEELEVRKEQGALVRSLFLRSIFFTFVLNDQRCHKYSCVFFSQEYMDPMNEHNALNEAKQMIAVADENQNHNLELDEILKYSEYFTGSKLMDYARNVHEEF